MFSLGNEERKHINVLFIMLEEMELSEPRKFKMYPLQKSTFAVFGIQFENLEFQTPRNSIVKILRQFLVFIQQISISCTFVCEHTQQKTFTWLATKMITGQIKSCEKLYDNRGCPNMTLHVMLVDFSPT